MTTFLDRNHNFILPSVGSSYDVTHRYDETYLKQKKNERQCNDSRETMELTKMFLNYVSNFKVKRGITADINCFISIRAFSLVLYESTKGQLSQESDKTFLDRKREDDFLTTQPT